MIKKLTILLFMSLLTVTAGAQMKFGYLSYQEAIQSMPDYAIAQRNMEKLREQYANETKRAEDEFNRKYEAFLEGQKDFDKPILRKRQAELQELLYKNIDFNKESERLLLQAEKDMYRPLHDKLNNVLRYIGETRGYAFIVNTDNNSLPFVNSAYGENITTIVIDTLNNIK